MIELALRDFCKWGERNEFYKSSQCARSIQLNVKPFFDILAFHCKQKGDALSWDMMVILSFYYTGFWVLGYELFVMMTFWVVVNSLL